MNSVERVKQICKERKIPISKLEKDLGFSNGYIAQLRKGIFPADRLAKISEYLNMSVDYLMTGQENSEKKESPFTARDERDIKKNLDKIMSSLETKDGAPLYYDGNELELTDENKAMLRDALNTALHTVKLINKEKYNPHKNGK